MTVAEKVTNALSSVFQTSVGSRSSEEVYLPLQLPHLVLNKLLDIDNSPGNKWVSIIVACKICLFKNSNNQGKIYYTAFSLFLPTSFSFFPTLPQERGDFLFYFVFSHSQSPNDILLAYVLTLMCKFDTLSCKWQSICQTEICF